DPAGHRQPVRVRRPGGSPRASQRRPDARARGGEPLTAQAAAAEHHGPPVANQSSRVDARVLGMLLFIASEVMLFGSFFTAYFFVRVVNGYPWPPHGFELPKFVAGVNTVILITSSFTVHWALQSIRRGNRAGLQAGLGLTVPIWLAVLLTPL